MGKLAHLRLAAIASRRKLIEKFAGSNWSSA